MDKNNTHDTITTNTHRIALREMKKLIVSLTLAFIMVLSSFIVIYALDVDSVITDDEMIIRFDYDLPPVENVPIKT